MIPPHAAPTAMWSDPDEGELVRDERRDPDYWTAYADRLAALDPQRAELLRLRAALADADAANGDDRRRYRQLREALSGYEEWAVSVLDDATIRNCGAAADAPLPVRFRFRCPNTWTGLAPTADANVRYCADCRRTVHLCDSVASAAQHTRQGHCIAVPAALTAGALLGDVHAVGAADVGAFPRPRRVERGSQHT